MGVPSDTAGLSTAVRRGAHADDLSPDLTIRASIEQVANALGLQRVRAQPRAGPELIRAVLSVSEASGRGRLHRSVVRCLWHIA